MGEALRMWRLGYGTVEQIAQVCGVRVWELKRAIREWRGQIETLIH